MSEKETEKEKNGRRLAVGIGLLVLVFAGVFHYVRKSHEPEPEATEAAAPAEGAPANDTPPAPAPAAQAPLPGAPGAPRDPEACLRCELENSQGTGRKCNHTSSTANELTADITKFGCAGFAGSEGQRCRTLLACLRGPACAADIDYAIAQQITWGPNSGYNETANRDDPTPCYCGHIPKSDFDTGKPSDPKDLTAGNIVVPGCISTPPGDMTGACASQYRAFVNVNVGTAYFSTDHGIGIANNLFTCDRDVPCAACFASP